MHTLIVAPGLFRVDGMLFEGVFGSPTGLKIDAPLLVNGPSGTFAPLSRLTDMELRLGSDFATDDVACGLFDGLDSLERLTIIAPGATRIFG